MTNSLLKESCLLLANRTGGKWLISALANTGCLRVICVLGELSLFAGGVSYDNNNNSTNNHCHAFLLLGSVFNSG